MKMRDMQLLVRVADTGSMTHAARQQHLTPAAVSGAIQRVEESLGIRLFERTTRSVHPTDEGLIVIEGCRKMLAQWQRVLDDAQDHQTELRGSIHLSAPADTTYGFLQSVVVDLCEAHPKLRVVLDISDAVQHLHRDAIDLAIRYGPLQDSSLTARKLVELPVILVASPAYIAAHGAPATVDALADHRCLTLQRANAPAMSWALHGEGVVRSVAPDSALCGDGYLVRQWALQGLGVGMKSLVDVIDDLEAGRLVRVLPDHTGGSLAVHVVFPSRRFLPARVRALDAAIGRQFAEREARCQAWLG